MRDGYLSKFLGVSAALMLLSASVVGAEERDPTKPRVPADQMADAKAMKNPVEATPDSIAKGRRCMKAREPASIAMGRKARAMVLPAPC